MRKLLYLCLLPLMFVSCDNDEETKIENLTVTAAKTDVSEFGGNDGSIILTVTGGKDPIAFKWSTGQTTPALENLTAGVYEVTVSDASSQMVIDSIEILQPANPDSVDLTVTYVKNDVTVFGGNDGSITLTVAGGKSPISISWSNGETTPTIENLIAGVYEVTVSDASERVVTESIEILEPAAAIILTDSVTMGAGYANDIYLSLENGIVSSPVRTAWDIAFYTHPQSSSIITNDGKGVKLYVWPNGNIDNWASVDTSNMVSWSAQYNTYSESTWEHGAFDKGALGHPDYGWGVYDMTTHELYGDSVHILVLADKSVKKLIIEKREASTNSFIIKYANIDGSGETTATIVSGSYLDKNLIHYSLVDNIVVDQEPASASWDLLFTKYYDESIPYIVTGVLTNNGIGIAELPGTDTASNDYASATYVNVINAIGSDWKSFNMETFTYDIAPNLFYVKDKNNNYYKIVFTGFDYTIGKFNYVETIY